MSALISPEPTLVVPTASLIHPVSRLPIVEHVIRNSHDATPLGKKAAIWLYRQSLELTRRVCLSVTKRETVDFQEIQDSVHDMNSSCGTTRLNSLKVLKESTFRFSHHGGCYINGLFGGFGGITIWLSTKYYDHDAEKLAPDMPAILAIEL